MSVRAFFRKVWLAYLRHTDSIRYARAIGVNMGSRCRLINVSWSSEPYLVRLGDHVSATSTRFETHDGGVWVFRDTHPQADVVRPITIGNNVFIGYGSMIMPGVTIGDNVVIGAGSIVTRNIPSNVVAVGSPAKPIHSIAEYFAKLSPEFSRTKQMNNKDKMEFYRTKFRR